jgi:hypothetical protein
MAIAARSELDTCGVRPIFMVVSSSDWNNHGVRDTTAPSSATIVHLERAARFAGQLEVAVAAPKGGVEARAALEMLRAELARALVDARPASTDRIVGLLAFLDGFDARLASGQVRSLGGLRRQCELLESL